MYYLDVSACWQDVSKRRVIFPMELGFATESLNILLMLDYFIFLM